MYMLYHKHYNHVNGHSLTYKTHHTGPSEDTEGYDFPGGVFPPAQMHKGQHREHHDLSWS